MIGENVLTFIDNHPNLADEYKIPGCSQIDPHPDFQDSNTYPNFQKEFHDHMDQIQNIIQNKESKTTYKFGDGDYYFLKKEHFGATEVGKRTTNKSFNEHLDHQEWLSGALKNDFVNVEIYSRNRNMFYEIFPDGIIHHPGEFAYALVANRWLFSALRGKKVGLIGAKEKVQIIEELVKHDQYKEYVGIDGFHEYIYIPQKFACDNLQGVEQSVGDTLQKSECDVFLIAIGHIKSALTHRLPKYKPVLYYDIGSGLDALAGCQNNGRPYFGNWINFRLRDYDYSSVDYYQYFGDTKENEGNHIYLD
tara:strand:- start:362 stop:1279 length:918 start_codon:yes stop_codon:yes gene_type:complete